MARRNNIYINIDWLTIFIWILLVVFGWMNIFADDFIVINDKMVAADIETWDSLNHSIMIAEVEECFSVKFGIREILRMENVGDMITLLEEKLAPA